MNGQSVYIAGGFNVSSNTHKPYTVPDLQLFSQATQRWQCLTIILNVEVSHTLSFNDNKFRKLIWTNAKNDTDNRIS